MTRHLWAALAWTSLILGIIGAFLPIMPTVPFILLAAFAAARGSQRLRHWLVTHPKFGQSIIDWERDGTVARRAKWLATGMMSASAVSMLVFSPVWWVPALGIAIMGSVTLWLWRRPEPKG
ncbi:YbaN family protein [Thermomonas sp.]|uniref:YbaN family protein n=1 Tax=Thermomonas sp. TaxID=1971895 RepID=UPI002C68AC24|nr:YbaN family protein [Thermomonas sp.]HRO62717.1 YbaN family protein [Thermomonas sp.]